jgi:hypothetical protein
MRLARLARLALLAAVLAAPAAAPAGELDFTPYLWLPSVEGTVGADTESTLPPVEFDAFSENLKLGGAMVNLTWREGRYLVFGDWTYANVRSSAPSPVGLLYAGVDLQIVGNILQLFSGYTLLDQDGLKLDAFLGARGYGLTARLGFDAGTLPEARSSTNEIWVDAVAGFRFDARFAGKWIAHLRADAGTGGSSLSWQGYAVGGYGFSWGDLVAGWRHLYVDKGEGATRLRLSLSGPLVGAHFTF